MHAVSLLVANLIIKTIEALRTGNFLALDANPGDMGCQNRALALRTLYKMGLPSEVELEELETVAQRIKQSVQNRKGGSKRPDNRPPDVFFQHELQSLQISRAMEYALHSFLSKSMNQEFGFLEDGRVREKSNVGQLSKLSPQIDKFLNPSLKTNILENNQTKLSHLSLEAVRKEAEQISSLSPEEKGIMELMLSPEHTHIYTANPAYAPKTFGCHFYEVKTLLHRLREDRGIVCIKSIVPKEKESFSLFFRSEGFGEDFTPISEQMIDPFYPIVVIEAVSHVDSYVLRDLLMQHGFTDVILSQMAKEDPYEQGSSIEAINEHNAFQEVYDYKRRGEEMSFLTVDHVYFTVKK